nr:MATE family efflux transporter [uncultured Sphaerochaeta sp.]
MENHIFEKMPVPQAILKSAIPTIIGMVVVLIYNIADTYFVGQIGDPLQVAAVSLTMPVFLLFMATGNLIGVGGTSVISRALGARRPEYAKHVSSFCFYASLVAGVVMLSLFLGLMTSILKLIGSSADTAPFARDYLVVVAPSAPFVILSTAFSNIVRAEGKAKEAMVGMLIGTVVNIILDPIMILSMDMGVAGAAWATLIGNVAGCVYFVYYILRKTTVLSLSIGDFKMGDKILTGVLAIGVPAALNNVLMSASNIILNNFLVQYGDIQVAAMGVAMKVAMIVALLQIGLGVGVQPLFGFNYGARNRARFMSILKVSLLYTVGMGLVLTVACRISAGVIVRAFIDSPEVYNFGTDFVKVLLLTGPVLGILFVFMNALQAVGAAKESLILSVSRQGLVFLPMLIILDRTLGLTGIVFAQPVADFFSLFMAAFLFFRINRRMWNRQESVELAS